MLKDVFISLASRYSEDLEYISSLWNKIVKNHCKKNRYYHNLIHLDNLFQHLESVKPSIKDWDIVLFALFYHDYIYNVLKQDNEAQSALKVVSVLNSLEIDIKRIQICKHIIIATKGHQISEQSDANYFTDADLSILGSDWETYQRYFKNVRKEYKYYPDFMYNKGRIKVLQHFIDMPRIFKTDYFYKKFEKRAKNNLQQEINLLLK